jgi:hypothetical protein
LRIGWQRLQLSVGDVVEDVGKGHLIFVIQQWIDGLFQPHAPLFFLGKPFDAKIQHPLGSCGQNALIFVVQRGISQDEVDVGQKIFVALLSLVSHRKGWTSGKLYWFSRDPPIDKLLLA